MSLDFSMIIITSVETIENAATTMIIVSSTNIMIRSDLSAWKKAGKNSFQSRVKNGKPSACDDRLADALRAVVVGGAHLDPVHHVLAAPEVLRRREAHVGEHLVVLKEA